MVFVTEISVRRIPVWTETLIDRHPDPCENFETWSEKNRHFIRTIIVEYPTILLIYSITNVSRIL